MSFPTLEHAKQWVPPYGPVSLPRAYYVPGLKEQIAKLKTYKEKLVAVRDAVAAEYDRQAQGFPRHKPPRGKTGRPSTITDGQRFPLYFQLDQYRVLKVQAAKENRAVSEIVRAALETALKNKAVPMIPRGSLKPLYGTAILASLDLVERTKKYVWDLGLALTAFVHLAIDNYLKAQETEVK